jgi:hypothetical protein
LRAPPPSGQASLTRAITVASVEGLLPAAAGCAT